MKKIILVIALVTTSAFSSKVACGYHLKEIRGLINSVEFAVGQKEMGYAKRAAVKFKRSLYSAIENCETDNPYIPIHKRLLSSFNEAGLYD